MTREEALTEWVIPAIEKTWNEKKCDEILKALEQEPKTGHWINHKDEHQCSQCRETVIADKDIWEEYPYDYCPNCGAKMQEVDE